MLPLALDTSDENAFQELSILLDKADRSIAKMDTQDENDYLDDDNSSSSSDDLKENPCETIEFYVGLFMKLIPSLERLHEQNSVPKQDDRQLLAFSMMFSSQPSLYDAIEASKPEGMKRTNQDQQALGIKEVGPSTGTISSEKEHTNMSNLGQGFEKLLASKRPSSTSAF